MLSLPLCMRGRLASSVPVSWTGVATALSQLFWGVLQAFKGRGLQAAWLPAFWGETYYLMADRLQFSSLRPGSPNNTSDTDLYE